MGLETNTGKFKFGDGSTLWNALSYAGGSVSSVGMTVPAFLSVSGSPVTGSGTLAVTLSGTALPVANGGTGQTTINAARAAWGEKVSVLTDAATIAVDASLANNFRVTLGGNRTLGNPTNLIDGQVLNFRIIQDGTGTRTLAYSSYYKFAGGTAPVLSTAAGAKDFMSCQYDVTDGTLFCSMIKAMA
jgi:hypothetical protein